MGVSRSFFSFLHFISVCLYVSNELNDTWIWLANIVRFRRCVCVCLVFFLRILKMSPASCRLFVCFSCHLMKLIHASKQKKKKKANTPCGSKMTEYVDSVWKPTKVSRFSKNKQVKTIDCDWLHTVNYNQWPSNFCTEKIQS